MENDELMKVVTEKANLWLGDGYDEATKAEVRRMLNAEDKTELIDSFYRDLYFFYLVRIAGYSQRPEDSDLYTLPVLENQFLPQEYRFRYIFVALLYNS